VNLHFYVDWKLTRADLVFATRRNLEAASPWLLARWRRHVEHVLATDEWPTYRTLTQILARDPAFARMPRGEHDVFR
jgi:hypothetical protein